MNREQVAKLVAMAAAGFPSLQDRDLRMTAELWYRMLHQEEYPQAEQALMMVLSKAKFFPTVAEVLEAMASLKPGLPGEEEAWREVLRNVRYVGYMRAPQWSHPAVERAALGLFGTWENLCRNLTSDSMVADRAHFLRMYQTIAKREADLAVLPAHLRQQIAGARANLALPSGRANG